MSALPRLVFALARALAVAGGVLLVGIGVLVTVSVLSRWLRNQAVSGDFELVQMGLALAVFAFLPLCQANRGHIVVDTFTMKLPLRVQHALDGIWDLVFAGVAALLAWRLAIGGAEAFRTGSTSMVLAIPIGWAILACAGMAAFLALVCLLTAAQRFRGGP
jgi:TRAP-type C4-dicarboxylate transport system permease small subunit